VESVRPAGLVQAPASGVVFGSSYFNQLADGEIWLLLIYPKGARENVPPHVLRVLKEEIKNASE
jgi:hypothetical protein